jgi:hypothetical protein
MERKIPDVAKEIYTSPLIEELGSVGELTLTNVYYSVG